MLLNRFESIKDFVWCLKNYKKARKFFFSGFIWDITYFNKYGSITYMESLPNRLVDEGEKAIIDIFLRKQDDTYFATDFFYTGLFHGSISESTTLLTIPGEPSGSGYQRLPIGRSTTGWPTLEKDEGDWRGVSTEVKQTASGGDIGPISGAFLATTLDDTGILIGTVTSPTEKTIKSGESASYQLRLKAK